MIIFFLLFYSGRSKDKIGVESQVLSAYFYFPFFLFNSTFASLYLHFCLRLCLCLPLTPAFLRFCDMKLLRKVSHKQQKCYLTFLVYLYNSVVSFTRILDFQDWCSHCHHLSSYTVTAAVAYLPLGRRTHFLKVRQELLSLIHQ